MDRDPVITPIRYAPPTRLVSPQLRLLNSYMSKPDLASRQGVHASTQLVIEGLHFDVSESDLTELFQPLGLATAFLKFDPSGRSMCTAILSFHSHQQARDAMDKHQGLVLDHMPMKIRWFDRHADAGLRRRREQPSSTEASWKHDRFDPARKPGHHSPQRDLFAHRTDSTPHAHRDYPKNANFDLRSLLSSPNRKVENYDLRQEIGYSTKELRSNMGIGYSTKELRSSQETGYSTKELRTNRDTRQTKRDLRPSLSNKNPDVIKVPLTEQPLFTTRPGDEEGEIILDTDVQPIVVSISHHQKRGRGRSLHRANPPSLHDRLAAIPVVASDSMDLD